MRVNDKGQIITRRSCFQSLRSRLEIIIGIRLPFHVKSQKLCFGLSSRMKLDQLKPNVIVRGAIFPEPVQVIVVVPMGSSVKLIGKGLTTGKVHEPILNAEQLERLGML